LTTSASAFAELGLPAHATEREVRAAWRRLVSQWHPDRNPSAEAVLRMQRINRAFGAIRDAGFTDPVDWQPFPDSSATPRPSAQAHASARHGAAEPPPRPEAAADEPGGARRRPIARRVRLSLEEAAAGCIKVLRGKVSETCGDCVGAGHEVLDGRCTHCLGLGRQVRRNFFGWPGESVPCEACGGSGRARRACPACNGRGSVSRSYQVKVRIPAGVRPGDRLHVPARRGGTQGPPADLDIRVEWLPHPFFELDADGTLRCEVPVDGFAWIAQREVTVPTLAGPRPLALRQDRLRYVLPGQGFPPRGKAAGPRPDQVLVVRPVFPDNPSADQRVLLAQLMATAAAEPPPPLRAWRSAMDAWERGRPGTGT